LGRDAQGKGRDIVLGRAKTRQNGGAVLRFNIEMLSETLKSHNGIGKPIVNATVSSGISGGISVKL
jgi:hypothetical protein